MGRSALSFAGTGFYLQTFVAAIFLSPESHKGLYLDGARGGGDQDLETDS